MRKLIPLGLFLIATGFAHADHAEHHDAAATPPKPAAAPAGGEKKAMGGMMMHHHPVCAYESKHYSAGALLVIKGAGTLQCVAGPVPSDPKVPQQRDYYWQLLKK